MPDGSVYSHLLKIKKDRGGGLCVLIDPDRSGEDACVALAESAGTCGVDAIFVGTSFLLSANFADRVKKIREAAVRGSANETRPVPVIIFPGSSSQVTQDADAVLFTSLISGRNPTYLIDEQVRGAPLIKRYGVEPIPTGYMLIESGRLTSVQYISGTLPIPRDKFDIACAHALAAQYMGMRFVYLEAGSGAQMPVPVDMVGPVSQYVDIPVIVGGGLRQPRDCAARIEAGASFVVVGNGLESKWDLGYLSDLAAAVHIKSTITA